MRKALLHENSIPYPESDEPIIPVSTLVFSLNEVANANASQLMFVARRILKDRVQPGQPTAVPYEALINQWYDGAFFTKALSAEELDHLVEHGFLEPTDIAYGFGPFGDEAAFLAQADVTYGAGPISLRFKPSRVKHRALFAQTIEGHKTREEFEQNLFNWQTVGAAWSYQRLTDPDAHGFKMLIFGSLTVEDIECVLLTEEQAKFTGPRLVEAGIPYATVA